MATPEAAFDALDDFLTASPIDVDAREQFYDVLTNAQSLFKKFKDGVPILAETARDRYSVQLPQMERLYICAIWRGRLVEAVESLGSTPENLNVFTRLLGGIRQIEKQFYPELHMVWRGD